MAKMTLLEMTQDILNDLDSDDVNDITDTVESEQVAQVLKSTYYAIVDEFQLPSKRILFKMDATTSATPTKMTIPDGIISIDQISYKISTTADPTVRYSSVEYIEPDDMLNLMYQRNADSSNVDVITDGIDYFVLNDAFPTYWTSFDDDSIIFDSYNSDEDSFLQQSKTTCYGESTGSWTHTNAAIPDLPENLFSLLLSEAKSRCFLNFKQLPNSKEEQYARRQRIAARKNKWKTNGGIKTNNYGRNV